MDENERLARDRARSAVARAIKRGELVRPDKCPQCGELERFRRDGRSLMHGHHYNGYDKKLDVQWLCIKCHFIEDPRSFGVSNGRAKINFEIAAQIRNRYNPGVNRHRCNNSARSLAREFGLNDRTVGRILRNEIWIDAALKGAEQ